MKNALQFMVFSCLAGLLFACSQGPGLDIAATKRDYVMFKTQVHPVLLRDCAFHACHGSSDRFFRVWGFGRVRLNPMDQEFMNLDGSSATTNNELDYSKQFAESMIDYQNPSRSLLLRKPLALEAGGSAHFGTDAFGRNVYRSVNDEGYLALARWVVAVAKPTTASSH